ncbi:MAG: hypothetical protein J5I93_11040 [Pirellulaceae bacterium]|nr:hypothetical protein [Pirellulaceae bacterium]
MSDHLSQSLDELKRAVIADGVVDANEVTRIRQRIYADGRIDRAEADFLFDINDAVSGRANHDTWQALFIEAVLSHLLSDANSPGEIDPDEAAWLVGRIGGDGQVDAVEKALLRQVRELGKSIPRELEQLLGSVGI